MFRALESTLAEASARLRRVVAMQLVRKMFSRPHLKCHERVNIFSLSPRLLKRRFFAHHGSTLAAARI